MPELPEVEALAAFLREHAAGRTIARRRRRRLPGAEDLRPAGHRAGGPGGHRRGPARQVPRPRLRRPAPGHPPGPGRLAALARRPRRHGPPRPGKGPLAVRVRLRRTRTAAGFDLTEAGTQKRLARLRRPRPGRGARASPASAPTRSPTASPWRRSRAILARRPYPDQGRAARPDGDRRDRQRLLRRDPARRPAVAVQARRLARPTTQVADAARRRSSTTLRDAVDRARGAGGRAT